MTARSFKGVMNMITPEIIVGLFSLIGTLVGTFGGIVTSTKLSNYRIEQLEKKVDKHNSVIERVYVVERDVKTAFNRLEEIREDLHELEHNKG